MSTGFLIILGIGAIFIAALVWRFIRAFNRSASESTKPEEHDLGKKL